MKTRYGVILALMVLPSVACAEFAVPDCATLEQWSAGLPAPASATERYDPAWQKKAAMAQEQLLSDQVVTATFGRPVSQWGDSNTQEARAALYACQQAARQRGDQPAAMRLGAAMSNVARAGRSSAVRANPDTARLQDPGCPRVGTWAVTAATLPDGTSLEARQAHLFADATTADVFGVPFSQWTGNEMQFATDLLNRCRQELLPRGTPTPPGSESANIRAGLEMARSFLSQRLRQQGSPRLRPG